MKTKTKFKLLIIPIIFFGFYVTVEAQPKKNASAIDYVFTCNLKNDAEAIAKYKHYHGEGVWPEVKKAAVESGAESIRIYLHETRLVMVISLPGSLPFEEFDKKYNASGKKIKEWGKIMSAYQESPPGAPENQTWVRMKSIYDYTRE